jgi:hypothetical protein
MNEEFKKLLAGMKEGEFRALSGIEPSPFDSNFLSKALDVAPSQPLMHFIKLDYFKTLLKNGTIRMQRLDKFKGDPHEGRFPSANTSQQSSLTRALTEQIGVPADSLKGYSDFTGGAKRKLTYVHCWFGRDKEDQKMWHEYGEGGQGVCIRTTARRLKEALGQLPDFAVDLYGVTYSGEDHPIPEIVSIFAACRKQDKFINEHEFRLIGVLGEETWKSSYGENGLDTPDHQSLKVNLERLFERIYVGPNAPNAVFAEVESIANKAAGCRVVHRSNLPQFSIV